MRPGAVFALVAALLAAAGCARSEPEREGPARPLDPRVEQLRRWVDFRWRRSWQDGGRGGHGALFFLSRFEFREQDRVAIGDDTASSQSEPQLPLAGVSLFEAMRHAQHFWGRLPTIEEWRGAVQGRAGWLYPWGDTIGNHVAANTARIGLWRRTRVGTFESGRNLGRAGSCYDLIGNVAEWTITPHAAVELERLWSSTTDFDHLEYRVGAGALRGKWWPRGLPHPSGPVDIWFAEFEAELLFETAVPEFEFCTIGFSCSQVEPLRPSGKSWADILGLRPRGARVRRWDLGFRMATDPNCILAGLERVEGEPSDAEVEAIRRFLFRYVDDFRAAARFRARRLHGASMRASLELPPIGAWGRLAYDLLSVRRP